MVMTVAVAVAAWFWWPATLLLFPFYIYLAVEKVFVSSPNWQKLETLKAGSAKWTPCAGTTVWLDSGWQVRAGGSEWHDIKIPSDVATISGLSRIDVLEFRVRFSMDTTENRQRIFLGAPGLGGRADIFLNGREVARGIYGFIPNEFEVTGLLKDAASGQNELLIRIRRGKPRLRAVNEMSLGPWFAAGVFRDVYVQARSRVFVEDIRMQPGEAEGEGVLHVSLNGDLDEPLAVTGELSDHEGNTVFEFEEIISGVKKRQTFSIPVTDVEIKPWSRFRPMLYTARVRVLSGDIADERAQSVGVKKLEIKPRQILINGQQKQLFGVRRTEHFPPYGAAFPGWAMKRDVEMAADARLNVLWSAHYPMHPLFLEACDKSGMYVVQDLPVADVLSCEQDVERALRTLDRLMRRAAAHPCFLFWYLDRIGRRVSDEAQSKIISFLKRAVNEGRLVVSPRLEQSLGIEQRGPDVVEAVIDVYQRWDFDGLMNTARSGRGVLCVLDMVDGKGGATGRRAREMKKAFMDQKVLQAADRAGVAGLIIGHMFGWGLRMGVMSVTRSKKVSADVVRDYLKSRATGVINVPRSVSLWTLRAPALGALVLVGFLVLLQQGFRFMFLNPELTVSLVSVPVLVCIKESTLILAALCLGYAMDRRPEYIMALSGYLRFPVFVRLAATWLYKVLLVGGLYAWCHGLGLAVLFMAGVGAPADLAGFLAVASLADIFFLILLFVECELWPVILGASLMHAVLLWEFLPLHFALACTLAAYLPFLIVVEYLRMRGRNS